MLNSRQNRKAKYAEAHEAPVKNYWVKTSEFGKIGDCGENNYSKAKSKNKMKMEGLKRNLTTFGLWYKHTGSQNHKKLNSAVKRLTDYYASLKEVMPKSEENNESN